MSSADHSRDHRERQKRGDRSYRILVNDRVVLELINSGRITDADAGDLRQLQVELSAIIQEHAALLKRIRH